MKKYFPVPPKVKAKVKSTTKISAVGFMGPKPSTSRGNSLGKSMIPKKYQSSPNLQMWIDKWTREGTSIRKIMESHTPFHGKEGNT